MCRPCLHAAIRCSRCCCLHMHHGCEPITSKLTQPPANHKQARTSIGQSQTSTHCMNHDGGGMACVHANNMNNIAPVVACTIEAHGLVPWHQACPSAAAAVPPATTNEPPPPLCKHGHTPAIKKSDCMGGAVLRGVKKARPTTKGEWGSMCNSYSPVKVLHEHELGSCSLDFFVLSLGLQPTKLSCFLQFIVGNLR